MSDPPSSTITAAKAPFDKSNADLILRSCDNVDFRVFKVFLSAASPFFESMFALPQPVENGSKVIEDLKDGLPVVPMAEPSEVVEKLLMFCYPSWDTDLDIRTLEAAQSVLDAAIKYEMQDMQDHMQELLIASSVSGQDELRPLRVFGIAFRYRLKKVAIVAMGHSRKYPILGQPYVKELDHITPRAYHQLLDYHWRCSTAAIDRATGLDWRHTWNAHDMIPECKTCSVRIIQVRGSSTKVRFTSKYWSEYMEKAKDALRERPCGASVLRSELVDGAMKTATKCAHCRTTSAGLTMWRFTEAFAREVEEATSAVELQLDF